MLWKRKKKADTHTDDALVIFGQWRCDGVELLAWHHHQQQQQQHDDPGSPTRGSISVTG